MLELDVGILELGQKLVHFFAEIIGRGGKVLVVRPGQREFHPPARPPQVEAVGLTQADMGAGDATQRAAQFGGDFILAARPPGPRRQRRHDPHPVEIEAADDRHHVLDLTAVLIGLEQRLDLGRLTVHIIEPNPVRSLQHDIKRSAIFARQQFFIDRRVHGNRGQRDHRSAAEDEKPRRQGEVEKPLIDALYPAPGSGHKSAALSFTFRHRRQTRRQQGTQRQRDKRRNRDRNGEHNTELGEQSPRGRRQKRDRQKNRNQRRRGGDHRKEHLSCADHRRRQRFQSHRAVAMHVLDHDNRVVDDHAGGEHERQQGQDVDRKTKQPDRRDRPDQRHRNGCGRDQGRAQRAHEGEDNREDDDDRDGEAGGDLAHRAADELGVVGNLDDPGIVETPVEAADRLVDRIRDRDGVGLGAPDNAETDHFAAIEQAVAFGIIGAVIGARDIAEPDIGAQL